MTPKGLMLDEIRPSSSSSFDHIARLGLSKPYASIASSAILERNSSRTRSANAILLACFVAIFDQRRDLGMLGRYFPCAVQLLIDAFGTCSVPPEEGAWLEAADGRRHPIKGSCSIGRARANTVVLESPKVSRRHALIHLQNIGELWLIDFGSSNGTFLNKRRIHHPIRLNDGDQITIGDQVFKVRDPVPISEESSKTDVMQGTLREIETVPCWLLVADIRGFTPLSRQMQSQDLDVFVGAWILSCKEIIENQHGIINKYLGDGFFTYWREAHTSPEEIVAEILR